MAVRLQGFCASSACTRRVCSSRHSKPTCAFRCGPQATNTIDLAKVKIQDKEGEKAFPAPLGRGAELRVGV